MLFTNQTHQTNIDTCVTCTTDENRSNKRKEINGEIRKEKTAIFLPLDMSKYRTWIYAYGKKLHQSGIVFSYSYEK